MTLFRFPIAAAFALALPASAAAAHKKAAPEDFVYAANTCIAGLSGAIGVKPALATAGWTEYDSNSISASYSLEGSNVTIVLAEVFGSPSCVVDGYLAADNTKGLDEIIEIGFRNAFGDRFKITKADTGSAYVIGKVAAILSFEDQNGEVNARLTAMVPTDADTFKSKLRKKP